MIKQVIVVRKDLLKGDHAIRKGKLAGQVAHASVGALMKYFHKEYLEPAEDHPDATYVRYDSGFVNTTSVLGEWLEGSFTKIVVGVEDLDELMEIKKKCDEYNVINALITDNGATEFHGVPTVTCLGIGPMDDIVLDQITGHLKLI